jgi:hypothetical protein
MMSSDIDRHVETTVGGVGGAIMIRRNRLASIRNLSRSLALMVALLGCASTTLAQASGTFTATGNLPGSFPWSATVLPSGKVLILIDGNGDTGQAAFNGLYDPSTGTFTATGDRTTDGGYSATRLYNGKVLIAQTWAQDVDGLWSLGHAEIYDPDAGTFSRTGDMTVQRAGGTATLLYNGKVLIAGGYPSASAEVYDPSTGTFAPTGDMNEPLSETATLLPNGKVLITRSAVYGNIVRHAELYDPSTGTFAFTGDMIARHTTSTARSYSRADRMETPAPRYMIPSQEYSALPAT